jgi:hypothetical protein
VADRPATDTAALGVEDARRRAETIRSDVRKYSRDSDAFVSVEVLRRWNLDYLLETADMLDALSVALEAARQETADVRSQHDAVMAGIRKVGGLHERVEGWRDSEYREWQVSLGRMVECPECAFCFDADATDILGDGSHEGYTCPNCGQKSPENFDKLEAEIAGLREERDRAVCSGCGQDVDEGGSCATAGCDSGEMIPASDLASALRESMELCNDIVADNEADSKELMRLRGSVAALTEALEFVAACEDPCVKCDDHVRAELARLRDGEPE